MEMKRKTLSFVLVLTLLLAIAFQVSSRHAAYAKAKYLKYLPQNQFVDMVSKELNKTVSEVNCSYTTDLFKKVSECETCINAQATCPDCCLTSSKTAIVCTSGAGSQYSCSTAPFSASSTSEGYCSAYKICMSAYTSSLDLCSDASSLNCHKKGCGSTEPDGTCDGYLCDEDNLSPKTAACSPVSASGLRDCSSYQPYSSITKVCTQTNPNNGECVKYRYQYTVNPNYQSCVNSCNAYVDTYRDCRQTVECCKKNACTSGFSGNCTQEDCETRISSATCANYTASDCVALENQVTECLDATGNCRQCFTDIDSDFVYKFVAKSREKIVVIWQISSTPLMTPADGTKTYFYTMVKVIDDESGDVAHQSFVSQKNFSEAFSVFSATNVSDGIEAGRRYRVKLYYFIPDLDENLKIEVNTVQMIMIRIRE
ncbi:MAG: hypothetical protein WBE75_01145 [Candidatus Omnitrophota bacterium]|jgi:hypothetical protein